jgi:cobalt-zinc-cadmium efflux system protein
MLWRVHYSTQFAAYKMMYIIVLALRPIRENGGWVIRLRHYRYRRSLCYTVSRLCVLADTGTFMMQHMQISRQRFALALILTALILAAEIVGGIITGSLALLSDAAHLLLDVVALGMSYAAVVVAARPPDARHTYGFHRFQVLAALANSVTLFVMAFFILREAWERWQDPQPVTAGLMLAVAVFGLVVNLVVLKVLGGHDHDDLNARSAFLHVLGDTVSSVGVIGAATLILFTGWTWADPLISALIAVLLLVSAARVLRAAVHILAEGTPEGVSAGDVARAMAATPGVCSVHDLHVWTVASGYTALSAHVVLSDASPVGARDVQHALRALVAEQFGIGHSTIQVEWEDCGQGAMTCANSY